MNHKTHLFGYNNCYFNIYKFLLCFLVFKLTVAVGQSKQASDPLSLTKMTYPIYSYFEKGSIKQVTMLKSKSKDSLNFFDTVFISHYNKNGFMNFETEFINAQRGYSFFYDYKDSILIKTVKIFGNYHKRVQSLEKDSLSNIDRWIIEEKFLDQKGHMYIFSSKYYDDKGVLIREKTKMSNTLYYYKGNRKYYTDLFYYIDTVIFLRHLYQFNDNNQISQYNEISFNQSIVDTFHSEYFYYINNLLVKTITFHNEDTFVCLRKNNDQKLLSECIIKRNNRTLDSIWFKYDSQGRLIQEKLVENLENEFVFEQFKPPYIIPPSNKIYPAISICDFKYNQKGNLEEIDYSINGKLQTIIYFNVEYFD